MDDSGTTRRLLSDGDGDAFARVFKRYYPSLSAYVRRRFGHLLRSDDQIDDVIQDTWLRFYGRSSRYDPKRDLRPYLLPIARGAALDAVRRMNRYQRSVGDRERAVKDVATSVTRRIRRAEWAARFDRALDRLEGLDRELALLRFDEVTWAEIADELARPVDTLRSRWKAVIGRLRDELGDDWNDYLESFA